MNRPLPVIALAAAIFFSMSAAFAAAEVIQVRQAGFRMMNDSMEAIQAVVQARRPNADALAPARAIAGHAPEIKTLFPAGSDTGAQTRALPTVWSDRAGFEQRADAFAQQAQALLAAAEGNDTAALGSVLQATGQACIACHREHRARQR